MCYNIIKDNRRDEPVESKVFETILKRRSIRRFKSDPIGDDMIDKLLESARWAPSAGNKQPWFFYVVKDEEKRQGLAEAALGQGFLSVAPVVIVVCAEPKRTGARYGKRGTDVYAYQDTAAAAQNIILTATEMGLGTCWVGAFSEEKVAFELGISDDLVPVVIIPVGYPDQAPRPPARRNVKEVSAVI
jgi:nitroreductase